MRALGIYRQFVKRLLDVVFASILLVFLLVPFACIALWIKLDSKGPVLFKHKRAGRNLVPFTVYKFRTMTPDAPKSSPTNSLKDAHAYITRAGRIMRKLSLDELPQLFNVLKNDMSIVGPRPVLLNEKRLLAERDKYGVNACKPGITGWAQVNGRDEVRIKQKAKMDGEYVSNISSFMDAKCLFMTVWAVLSVDGHKEGHESDDGWLDVPDATKKVLFTSHTANFSKFNRPFMRWFTRFGYEVHYASAGEEQVKDCDKHFTVPFERSPLKANNLRAMRQLKKIIDAEQYDIIHTHTPMGSVVTRLAANAARRKHGTRVIYTAHGFHFFKGAPLINWLIYYPIEKFMARFTDTLVTINKEDYTRAKKKFRTEVKYIPGVGVDLTRFATKMSTVEKRELRKTLGLGVKDFVLIYTAELNANKNQVMLIQAMESLIKRQPNIHLLLAGDGELASHYKAEVKSKGMAGNIHFLGYRHDVPALLQISDVAVSTSKREGLPVNIMEAMATGLPIVATDCRGQADLVKNGINGFLVDSNDVKNLKKKVSKIFADKVLKNNLGRNSVNSAKKYDLRLLLDEMAVIYGKDGYHDVS